ncbi:MAG TPA: response regulator, partial [Terriglobales bacterium]|nr:response regulator [Terriglobales bacterium]
MIVPRILCVDDDPRINELNEIVLGRAGYEVQIAISPSDALERFAADRFDLVITDLFSNTSSDAGFISKLRSIDPKVPVIIVSGQTSPPPEVLEKADAFVQKAYSLNALKDTVREVLMREKL